jgi:ABC-type glycerol-3-phosphate transport system permease component
MTPLYVLLSAAHLRTTQLGLLLVYAGFSMPFCVWLMRGAFRVVPRELDEAAVVEGAGSWAIFRHIALPLALPSILVAGLLAFLVGYSEFAIGWLFVDRADLVTLAMAVSGTGVGLQGGQWARMAALSILMSLPVVVLFLAVQGRLFGAFAASLEDE